MTWKYEEDFIKMNGSKGKKYYNEELHRNLWVGINPFIHSETQWFVIIEDSRFGCNPGHIWAEEKWFTSEKDAYEYAYKYMRKNK